MGAPFDTSFLLKVRGPEFELPSEQYRRITSLRDLADRRRMQEQQYRMHEMDIRQKQLEMKRAQEDWDATQRIIGGFTSGELGENSTLAQLASKGNLSAALKVDQAMQQRLNAKRMADKAGMDLAEAKRKEQNEKERQTADVLYGVRQAGADLQATPEFNLPGSKRQAAMDVAVMEDLMRPEGQRLGLGREGEPTRLAPSEQEFQARYSAAYTPKETQALLEAETAAKAKRTTEALDISDKQWKQAIPLFLAANNQGAWTRARNAAPPHVRATIPEEFNSANKQSVIAMGTPPGQILPDQIGDWVRIATDPNSTPEQQRQADEALKLHREQARAGATTIGPHQKVGDEAKLRDDFRQESKNFVTIRDSWNRIQGTANSRTGPGDMSLIFAYMKLLDPGSTVREGEYATAQNAGSIPQRIWALYNKAVDGQILDDTVRGHFVEEAGKIYRQTDADHQKIRSTYRRIAERSGLDPENVVVDYSSGIVPPRSRQQQTAPPPSGSVPASQIPNPLVDAKPAPRPGDLKTSQTGTYRFDGGDPNKKENWKKVK